jgi:hypothetical protein
VADEEKRPPWRPTDYKPEYCELVVSEMAKGYSLGAFAGTIGVSRATINVWMAKHPDFLEATSRGKAARLKQWETAGLKSAYTQEGGHPGMIQFGLRNAGKEDWVDEKNVNLSGAVGSYDLSKLPLEQLRNLRQILGPLADAGGDRQVDSET